MSNESRWSRALAEAEERLADGDPLGARTLAQQVQDEAREERKNHVIGSAARRSCALTMATANIVLDRVARGYSRGEIDNDSRNGDR